jgi:transposase
MAGMTAGIDWASEAHEVCISEEGEALERFSVAHDERGIAGLARRLTKLGVARVAIERPDGILVERLLAAGLEVLAIHPNQVKAARARFAVAHGKSDRFDAYVLAELARTDAHRFRALVPDSEETKALKTLTRAREDLVGIRVELANQLRVATFRRACDKRLRVAVATLADSTRHWHPWAKEVYRRARARGQDHPHAIRTLGRAWIRVLWRCWQDGVPYDATLHGNSHRLQPAGG